MKLRYNVKHFQSLPEFQKHLDSLDVMTTEILSTVPTYVGGYFQHTIVYLTW